MILTCPNCGHEFAKPRRTRKSAAEKKEPTELGKAANAAIIWFGSEHGKRFGELRISNWPHENERVQKMLLASGWNNPQIGAEKAKADFVRRCKCLLLDDKLNGKARTLSLLEQDWVWNKYNVEVLEKAKESYTDWKSKNPSVGVDIDEEEIDSRLLRNRK